MNGMNDKAPKDRDKKSSKGGSPNRIDKAPGMDKERLKGFVKKKLKSVHQEVIAPPGQ